MDLKLDRKIEKNATPSRPVGATTLFFIGSRFYKLARYIQRDQIWRFLKSLCDKFS